MLGYIWFWARFTSIIEYHMLIWILKILKIGKQTQMGLFEQTYLKKKKESRLYVWQLEIFKEQERRISWQVQTVALIKSYRVPCV